MCKDSREPCRREHARGPGARPMAAAGCARGCTSSDVSCASASTRGPAMAPLPPSRCRRGEDEVVLRELLGFPASHLLPGSATRRRRRSARVKPRSRSGTARRSWSSPPSLRFDGSALRGATVHDLQRTAQATQGPTAPRDAPYATALRDPEVPHRAMRHLLYSRPARRCILRGQRRESSHTAHRSGRGGIP
jgi:hypothetical protein